MTFCLRLVTLFLMIGSLSQSLVFANDPPARPNVLFIAVDDLRAELGCYGSPLVKSPHIDRLASQGLLFSRAYCQQALCNPSRASLLTGMRPDTLGVTDLPTHFREQHPNIVTLPQLFKQHGYETRDIGKIFHNWRQDDYKGDPQSWSQPAVLHYGTHNRDKPIVEGELPPDLAGVQKTECRDVPDDAYLDGRIADLAIKSLQELKNRPFFLAVGFWKPHLPFCVPKKYWDLYDPADIHLAEHPQPPEDVPPIALHNGRELLRSFDWRLTTKQALTLRHGYYAATSYLDAQIGKVLAELDRLGLRKNTIVVFWSDHGFHLGEHDLWCKTSNFELDARVPLIISLPNQKTAGSQTDSLVELLDLYPTLADLCALPRAADLEGVSLRPLFDDPQAKVKQAAFTQHPRPAYRKGDEAPEVMGYSLRTERYRYTEWRRLEDDTLLARELYDHQVDPQETKNLAGGTEQAETVRRLGRLLQEQLKASAQATQ